MNSLDAITLKAFLVALTQLEGSLSIEFQGELNAIGKEFPSGVSRLHRLAKRLAPLEQAYKKARRILQADVGERLRFAGSDFEDEAQSSEKEVWSLAIKVLNASDSVALAKEIAEESVAMKPLLVQLQSEMSIRVANAPAEPETSSTSQESNIFWEKSSNEVPTTQDNPEFEAAMQAFAITRKNYRNAFRELAK